MNFNNQLPEWKNEGVEPSESLKTNGFSVKFKPPADIFNWFWSKVSKAITEIQTNLNKVDNTSDAEKSVKFASEAKEARKVQHSLTVRFKGVDTEGTDKWTFDGSTSRSVNITPAKIEAADKEHTHSVVDINKVVVASSTDGITYTAEIDGITELYEGLEITICPDISNTSNAMTLNVNGLGDKPIRRPLSFSTYVADSAKEGFLHKDAPCRLMYHAEYPNRVNDVSGEGVWLMADKVKTSAQDLYGTVPVESGGTGASTAEGARTNLEITPANIGAARIVHGSYVGTNTSGSTNPNTLTFDFQPKVVMVQRNTPDIGAYLSDGYLDYFIATRGVTQAIVGHYTDSNNVKAHSVYITWNGNSISWYASDANDQLNESGITYYYIAIG